MRILRHEEVDSTNERALAAIAEGVARDGDVHVARVQTAGRGRLGRRWESAPGAGLYLSYVHLPPPPPVAPERLTLAAGLAVLGAVQGLGCERALLKWPNDVLVEGAKLAGILVESRGLDPRAPHAVIGVGLNVLQRDFPTELTGERPVTSLALEGVGAGVDEALGAVLEELPPWLARTSTAPGLVFERYLQATGLCGAEVEIHIGQERHRGCLRELDHGRGLGLDPGDGLRWFPLAHVAGLRRIESPAPDAR